MARSSLGARRLSLVSRPVPALGAADSSDRPSGVRPSWSRRRLAGIGGALDQPGANQGIDGATDGRRTAADASGHLVKRRRLARGNGGEQAAAGAVGALHGAIGDEGLRQSREASGDGRRRRSPEHDCSVANIT